MNAFLSFIAIWALRSTVVVVAAALAQVCLWNRSAATKNLVWRTAIVCVALVPALTFLTPAIEAPISAPVEISQDVAPYQPPIVQPKTGTPYQSPEDRSEPVAEVALFIVYILGGVVCLGRWGAGIMQFRKILVTAEPDAQNPRLRTARNQALSVPVTCGWRSPIILLPNQSVDWPTELVDAAIAHESAHIRRCDWAFQCFGTIVTALQWFNPAIWIAISRMKATAEEAADDAVLREGVQASRYAEALLDVAAGLTKPAQSGVAMVRTAAISRRLGRVVAAKVNRESPSATVLIAISALLLASAGTADALRFAQTHSAFLNGDWDWLFYSMPAKTKVAFGSGSTAELVELHENQPIHGFVFWAPEGRPMPFNLVDATSGPNYSNSGFAADHRQVDLKFQFTHLPSAETGFQLKVDGGMVFSSTFTAGPVYRPVVDVPKSLKVTDFSLGIPLRPFTNLYSCPLANPKLVAAKMEFNLPKSTTICSVYLVTPANQLKTDYQVVAHLTNGKALPAYGRSDVGIKTGGQVARMFDFQCGLADIKSLDLQSRPMQWVKFERIKLYPDASASNDPDAQD